MVSPFILCLMILNTFILQHQRPRKKIATFDLLKKNLGLNYVDKQYVGYS